MTVRPRDWDAGTYDAVGAPVQAFGHALLDRLALNGDETALDAGCGSGAVTQALLDRLPRGRVIAVDGSPAMVEKARAELAGDPRADVRRADLVELELGEPVDVVFSSAVFHWIADHDRLFARLHVALRPGGRLLAQCGGQGNIADVRQALALATADEPFAEHFGGWEGPWNFSPPHLACERLERAGFVDVRAGTHIEPVRPDDPHGFLRTMILGGHLDRLPEDLRDPFVARVRESMAQPDEARYVRLTLTARRDTIAA
jgi:trans-aconitate 2-methyltransferase